GNSGMTRRGPADLGLRCFCRTLLDHAQLRNLSTDGAQYIKSVKGWAPRSPLSQIHPRIREPQAGTRSGRRAVQQHALAAESDVLRRQFRADLRPLHIEEKRILECFLREDVFAQSRQEDDVER